MLRLVLAFAFAFASGLAFAAAGDTAGGGGGPRFEDVTAASGLVFQHSNGASAEKYFPETMGAGVCLFDADGDGRIDVYLVDGGPPVKDGAFPPGPPDRLFRNVSPPGGPIRFEDVTAASGLGDRGYGMGCAVGDFDNDGDEDLYVTNYLGNTLWRNDGKGKFTEVGETAGVRCGRWSTSAAFGDFDQDGLLDLYVANYVDFTIRNNKYCGDLSRGLRSYCHPDVYDGVAPALYHNLGGGRFRDVAQEAGVALTSGKGLGVVLADLDGDGLIDIYGANDSTIHYLFHNLGKMTFKDLSLLSGAGFDANGRALAGMGVDAGDTDGDGAPELFVTNLDLETNTLYHNNGAGRFRDVTGEAGLALPGLLNVGFGTVFADVDQDGDLDIVIVNGHIIDNVEKFKDSVTYAEPPQLFVNDGRGKFEDVSAGAGPFFSRRIVARGLAAADLDGDGDLDLVLTTNGGPAYVLENRTQGGHALLVKLRGTRSNRDGFGARLTLEIGGGGASFGTGNGTGTGTRAGPGAPAAAPAEAPASAPRKLVRDCKSSSSYLSQGDSRVHFGLGDAAPGKLTVRWPSGGTSVIDGLHPDEQVVIEEGKGIVSRSPLAPPAARARSPLGSPPVKP